MKLSNIIYMMSLGFLSYYAYSKFQKNEEIVMEIKQDKEEEIIMEIDEDKEETVEEPLTPTQQIVYDHFQIAHR